MRLYLFEYAIQHSTGVPVPGYLIQTTDGINILVDTGFPPEAVGVELPIPDLTVTAEHLVTHHLAQLDLTPADIDYLICTHFDLDHSGANHLFPEATHVVQQTHYQFATGPDGGRFDLYRENWHHPDLTFKQIDGDHELLPGIILIDSSGHVPGHQSIQLQLPETGSVLLAIDAIVETTQIDPDTFEPNGADMDNAAALVTLERLREHIKEENIPLTICGHDPYQWPTLRKAPEFYT